MAGGTADSSGQFGGTFGARQTIGTSTILVGGTGGVAQRNKDQVGEGAFMSIYNITDNIVYLVSYFLSSVGPPRQAIIFVRY